LLSFGLRALSTSVLFLVVGSQTLHACKWWILGAGNPPREFPEVRLGPESQAIVDAALAANRIPEEALVHNLSIALSLPVEEAIEAVEGAYRGWLRMPRYRSRRVQGFDHASALMDASTGAFHWLVSKGIPTAEAREACVVKHYTQYRWLRSKGYAHSEALHSSARDHAATYHGLRTLKAIAHEESIHVLETPALLRRWKDYRWYRYYGNSHVEAKEAVLSRLGRKYNWLIKRGIAHSIAITPTAQANARILVRLVTAGASQQNVLEVIESGVNSRAYTNLVRNNVPHSEAMEAAEVEAIYSALLPLNVSHEERMRLVDEVDEDTDDVDALAYYIAAGVGFEKAMEAQGEAYQEDLRALFEGLGDFDEALLRCEDVISDDIDAFVTLRKTGWSSDEAQSLLSSRSLDEAELKLLKELKRVHGLSVDEAIAATEESDTELGLYKEFRDLGVKHKGSIHLVKNFSDYPDEALKTYKALIQAGVSKAKAATMMRRQSDWEVLTEHVPALKRAAVLDEEIVEVLKEDWDLGKYWRLRAGGMAHSGAVGFLGDDE
jgi:hypothetical protein